MSKKILSFSAMFFLLSSSIILCYYWVVPKYDGRQIQTLITYNTAFMKDIGFPPGLKLRSSPNNTLFFFTKSRIPEAKPYLMVWDELNWQDTKVNQAIGVEKAIGELDMEVSSNGIVYVVYEYEQSPETVSLMYWQHDVWQIVGDIYIGNHMGWDFTISPDNSLYLVWSQNNFLKMASLSTDNINDIAKVILPSDNNSIKGYYPQLHFTNDNELYLLSFDDDQQFKISSWEAEWQTIGTFSTGLLTDDNSRPKLVSTPTNELYVGWVYQNQVIKIATWSAQQQIWSFLPTTLSKLDEIRGYRQMQFDIEFNLDGELFLAYVLSNNPKYRPTIFVSKWVGEWNQLYNETKKTVAISAEHTYDIRPELAFTSENIAILGWQSKSIATNNEFTSLEVLFWNE